MSSRNDAAKQSPGPAGAFTARWVLPADGPAIANGLIEVDADGTIVAIETAPRRDALDLGDVAIVPALVNAHVHLEFSDLDGPIEPAFPFPRWIENVVAHRRARSAPIAQIICRGARELQRTGTVAAGEIATASIDQAYQRPEDRLLLCLFHELIGPKSDSWPDLLDGAKRHVFSSAGSPGVLAGLSPHAPYTVPRGLYEQVIELAVATDVPVAIHLAETPAERALLSRGKGELVEMLNRFDLWEPSCNPIGQTFSDWLALLARTRSGLVIHGNDLNDKELDLLADSPTLTLVYCPRTHAYFRRPKHPFKRLLDRGGRLALGTDGRSSNPDLSLWSEAVYLAQAEPDLSHELILEFVTRRPAEALGIAGRAGILAPGRQANFLAIARRGGIDPQNVFDPRSRPTRFFHRGIEISERQPGGS